MQQRRQSASQPGGSLARSLARRFTHFTLLLLASLRRRRCRRCSSSQADFRSNSPAARARWLTALSRARLRRRLRRVHEPASA